MTTKNYVPFLNRYTVSELKSVIKAKGIFTPGGITGLRKADLVKVVAKSMNRGCTAPQYKDSGDGKIPPPRGYPKAAQRKPRARRARVLGVGVPAVVTNYAPPRRSKA